MMQYRLKPLTSICIACALGMSACTQMRNANGNQSQTDIAIGLDRATGRIVWEASDRVSGKTADALDRLMVDVGSVGAGLEGNTTVCADQSGRVLCVGVGSQGNWAFRWYVAPRWSEDRLRLISANDLGPITDVSSDYVLFHDAAVIPDVPVMTTRTFRLSDGAELKSSWPVAAVGNGLVVGLDSSRRTVAIMHEAVGSREFKADAVWSPRDVGSVIEDVACVQATNQVVVITSADSQRTWSLHLLDDRALEVVAIEHVWPVLAVSADGTVLAQYESREAIAIVDTQKSPIVRSRWGISNYAISSVSPSGCYAVGVKGTYPLARPGVVRATPLSSSTTNPFSKGLQIMAWLANED